MFGGISSEMPPFELLAKKNGYEIRRYGKQCLARVTYDVPKTADFSSESGTGFFPLFKYISGNNVTDTKISMTAPVIMNESGNGERVKRSMSFIMSPSKFTELRQLPLANDGTVQLVEEENSRPMACITFNMSMSTERNTAKENELRQAACRDGIQLSTDPADVQYFGYNAPFTIPYFRRNEICIPVVSSID
jgi:hypothetical protein